MDLADFAKVSRRQGKIVIEIPEEAVLSLAPECLHQRAVVTDAERVLAHVAAHLTSRQRSYLDRRESALQQLIGETLAEAAHARAGLEWNDPEKHMLLHE